MSVYDELPSIPMRLPCEACGRLHIDEGEFATTPHHTHSCQYCGLTWRPARQHTVGVRFLPGFKNEAEPVSQETEALLQEAAEFVRQRLAVQRPGS